MPDVYMRLASLEAAISFLMQRLRPELTPLVSDRCIRSDATTTQMGCVHAACNFGGGHLIPHAAPAPRAYAAPLLIP